MKKKTSAASKDYEKASAYGAAFGVLLVLAPIFLGAHGYLILFSFGSLIIVVGGVIAVAFMSFDAVNVHKALTAIKSMFKKRADKRDLLAVDMANIIKWSGVINEKGMRNFESLVVREGISDSFIKYGLNMVLSEYGPDEVRHMLDTAADADFERENVPVDILQAMTSHAPAFGMVGTLIGMVAMLSNLTDNISGIGASLAVAFLSTLYGVMSARMVYMPAAARLRQEIMRRRFRHHLITEGLTMLASKKTPMHIQDRLNSFLRPEIHDYFDYFSAYERPNVSPKLKVVMA